MQRLFAGVRVFGPRHGVLSDGLPLKLSDQTASSTTSSMAQPSSQKKLEEQEHILKHAKHLFPVSLSQKTVPIQHTLSN